MFGSVDLAERFQTPLERAVVLVLNERQNISPAGDG